MSCSRNRQEPRTVQGIEIGCRLRVRDSSGEDEYTLVPQGESDPVWGLISVESPVGRAILGRRLGDEVVVRTPGGLRSLIIVEVAAPAESPEPVCELRADGVSTATAVSEPWELR